MVCHYIVGICAWFREAKKRPSFMPPKRSTCNENWRCRGVDVSNITCGMSGVHLEHAHLPPHLLRMLNTETRPIIAFCIVPGCGIRGRIYRHTQQARELKLMQNKLLNDKQ